MPRKDPAARREAHAAYYRRRLLEDPEFKARHYAYVRATQQATRVKIAGLVAAFKAGGCAACGERTPCCLSAHHRDPADKDFPVGDASTGKKYSARQVEAELAKCVCVCHNCHAKIHAGVAVAPGLAE